MAPDETADPPQSPELTRNVNARGRLDPKTGFGVHCGQLATDDPPCHKPLMSLKGIAKATIEITATGTYRTPSGTLRDIGPQVQHAIAGTRLYEPAELATLAARNMAPTSGAAARIEVLSGTTQAVTRALYLEGCRDIVMLAFASARNPGGGFVRGAKAQEEDLARCSSLYTCLLQQPQYYERNRLESSLLYTDHIIYSPEVPFFRVKGRDLLEEPFTASVITAPAPNAGQFLRREPGREADVDVTLRRRARYVLEVALANGHQTLVLGAWGCGVFQNDPEAVASAFGDWLEAPEFADAFKRVVFGIYDRTKSAGTLRAFQHRFESGTKGDA